MVPSLLILGLFVSIAIGMPLAAWLRRPPPGETRQQATAATGCLGLILGVGLYFCVLLVALAVAIIA